MSARARRPGAFLVALGVAVGCNAILDNKEREAGDPATSSGASNGRGGNAGSGAGRGGSGGSNGSGATGATTSNGGRSSASGGRGDAGGMGDAGAAGTIGGVAGAAGGGEAGVGGGGPTRCRPAETRPCSSLDATLLGNCANGAVTCLDDGTWSECDTTPGEDSCLEPGDDADCDGTPNSGCLCVDGEEQPCGSETDEGICAFGTSLCSDQKWGPCEGAITKEPRDCRSSQDNDCDGAPDNTLDDVCQCVPNATEKCTDALDGIGVCRGGTRTCVPSADISSTAWGPCAGKVAPTTEVCNDDGKDEDCDGKANENPPCACLNGKSQPCGNCGTQTCVNGAWAPCKGEGTGPPVDYFLDDDGDTYGDPSKRTVSCSGPPAKHVTNTSDCCDSDKRVHPFAGFTVGNDGGCNKGADFNCDGKTELLYAGEETWNGCCHERIDGCFASPGWTSGRPGCGETAGYTYTPFEDWCYEQSHVQECK